MPNAVDFTSFSSGIQMALVRFVAKTVSAEALVWNPNTESDLDAYKLHFGTAAGTYTVHADVGNVTSYTVGVFRPARSTTSPSRPTIWAALRVALRTRLARAGDLQGSSHSRHPR